MVQNKNNLESEIILVLLKDKSHLREIARTLNESHSTILRKINELLKEKVLDYKKEGRNKTFFIKNNLKSKNYVYSAEIHKLNNLLKKHPELSIIFEDLKKNFPKGMVILFGSYAKGAPKQDSDIDVYLETNDNKVKNKVKEVNSKLSIKIGKFDVKSLLIKEIIKNHVIIRGLEDFYERVDFFKEA
ncbi:nucleotidyltransferase domain-containing protein [Candidatus Pacearchaeota archaeon]|nr:nucleotidyltransferase domain-containing protein [Candidatus Pacearchaeota archaeon]